MKNIAAAFLFFTRLPLWRLKYFQLDAKYFKQVIGYWPIVGWFTAAVMAGSLWLSAQFLPYSMAVIIALLSRVLVTGALHEDGLADFFDGFGGGTTRERRLEIMKDSHIGTYGVLSLIFYFGFMYQVLYTLDLHAACVLILVADPLCKFISSLIPHFLPYARTEATSKAKVVYIKNSWATLILGACFAFIPYVFLVHGVQMVAILLPLFSFAVKIWFMRAKIGGYTGDCCGAMFLLTELSFYIGMLTL